jgi:hypothetical protein
VWPEFVSPLEPGWRWIIEPWVAAAAAEVVALDAAGEAVALRDADHVDAVARGEGLDRDGGPTSTSSIADGELADRALRFEAGLLEAAGEGAGDARLLDVAEASATAS